MKKNKIFVLVAALVAVIVFIAVAMNANKTGEPIVSDQTVGAPAQTAGDQPVNMELFVRPHSPSMGNAVARVVVVEWFDPECESCRLMHPIFKKVVEDYKTKVHFVLRYMPYHNNSMHAASALEEAKEFGKFEEALDALFDTQPQWGDHRAPKPELIGATLQKLGIPKEKLGADYLIKKHGAKIQMDEADGNQLGVRGTPTFFVNGKMLPQLGEQPLREAIDQALAGSK